MDAIHPGISNPSQARDLAKGSITKIDGHLSGGSFSPDGKWIAALQLGDPKAPSKTVLIDRTNLARRRDLGA